MKLFCLPLLLLGTAACVGGAGPDPVTLSPDDSGPNSKHTPTSPLHIVTWNVEHLAAPADTGCKPRTPQELAAMQQYAGQLDADIVALQEVASVAAVEQLFPAPTWQVFVSNRPDSEPFECRNNGASSTQQKVAFAVKSAIEVESVDSVPALGLAMPGLRFGLGITVTSPAGPLALLNVHMKSGCFEDDYRQSTSQACQTFAQQVPVLDSWIAQREATGTPYAVLGDFNHRLSAPYNRLTRQLIDDTRSTAIATDQLIGCHPQYPAPIDHIVIGGMDARSATASAKVHHFDSQMLSDHCAVSVKLFANDLPLSAAVTWQTHSKEYRLLTAGMYRQAEAALADITATSDNWVVVMDVDETVLDNSAYQRETEQSGMGYSTDTWNGWVRREAAGLVPGAEAFIKAVFDHGGKVALVTNRDRSLDAHTWQNLQAQGIPVTADNTCLIGRAAADKQAVGQQNIVNDKDLRRQQIEQGRAACHAASAHWSKPHRIVMQVGDNIEDFAGVTQDDANVEALLPALGQSVFLLPNPMYGSWN